MSELSFDQRRELLRKAELAKEAPQTTTDYNQETQAQIALYKQERQVSRGVSDSLAESVTKRVVTPPPTGPVSTLISLESSPKPVVNINDAVTQRIPIIHAELLSDKRAAEAAARTAQAAPIMAGSVELEEPTVTSAPAAERKPSRRGLIKGGIAAIGLITAGELSLYAGSGLARTVDGNGVGSILKGTNKGLPEFKDVSGDVKNLHVEAYESLISKVTGDDASQKEGN